MLDILWFYATLFPAKNHVKRSFKYTTHLTITSLFGNCLSYLMLFGNGKTTSSGDSGLGSFGLDSLELPKRPGGPVLAAGSGRIGGVFKRWGEKPRNP